MHVDPFEFEGTPRFRVRRRIGAGAFGVVYEADDETRGGRVALKVLHRADGGSLVRFKHEFRSLADLAHPNLVSLHELASHAGRWFFTMDYVEGTDIVSAIWGIERPDVSESRLIRTLKRSQRTTMDEISIDDIADEPEDARAEAPKFDPAKLRTLVIELAAGLGALHAAGRVHRDIKPSNVLVDAGGRVRILDFGLVTDPEDTESQERVVGTPAYMAPEQAMGESVTSASDWYAVGVMLYLVMTGRLPMRGSASQVIARKQWEDPPRPGSLVSGLPTDLEALCVDLLRRDPEARPRARQVIERVAGGAKHTEIPRSPPRHAHGAGAVPFVGRSEELEQLASAYRAMRGGQPVLVRVRGPSGIGKTTLVRRFLEQAQRADPNAIVLSGRCYARESVPYKALDSLMDLLAQRMKRLPKDELHAVLPRHMPALARIFPVLRELDTRTREPVPDTFEERRRGVRALRELLARLADRSRLILFIDDLQWGDADSAMVLEEILAPPDPPNFLLVVGFRSADAHASAASARVSELKGSANLVARDIEVRALSDDDAAALVTELHADGMNAEAARRIVKDGRGVPFFLGELVRYWQTSGESNADANAKSDGRAGDLTPFDALVRARVRELDDRARSVLSVVAVSGKPLARDMVRAAANVHGTDMDAVEALRAANLLRTRGAVLDEELETYHDRVREAVLASLDEETTRNTHARIAEALLAAPAQDAEELAFHYRGAGDARRARVWVERAADRAAETLAFDRAAELFAAAIDVAEANELQPLRAKLALALANAGRALDAGRAYLAAVTGAPKGQAVELKRRAAEQFLRAGHIDDGLAVAQEVLGALGMRFPQSAPNALASLLLERSKLKLRGLDFAEKPANSVNAAELFRIDTCWSIGNGLGGVDLLRGSYFQARHLNTALRAGDAYRIARALAWEAVFAAIEGDTARVRQIVPRAMAIAKRIGNQHALAWATAAEAIAAWCTAEWPTAKSRSEDAIALFKEHCADIGWEVGSMEMWWCLPAQRYLGELRALSERGPGCAREAADRGDLYTAVGVRTYVMPIVHLVNDDPDSAIRDMDDAISHFGEHLWLVHHYCHTFMSAHVRLYAGKPERALDDLAAARPRMKRAMHFRAQTMRINTADTRSRVALSAATRARGTDREKHLALAAEDAVALMKEPFAWPRACAVGVEAGILAVRGDRDRARAKYGDAARAFESLAMPLEASAMRAREGTLEGGDGGLAKRGVAISWILDAGVRAPEKMIDAIAPAG